MSTIKVNKIEKRTGSTLTLGGACTAVTLACGATQTGFGRTGTVDWCTTAKTSPFTSVSGKGYFVNTTGGVVTVTLPASPSAGDIVSIKDYANTFDTNSVTVGRNGSKIAGLCIDATLSTEGDSITLVYVDATQGWLNIQTDDTIQGSEYVVATGGTETTCGDFKIHTFTSDGNFIVSDAGTPAGSNKVSYLVVAAGGGGGSGYGGGGGAGGFREGKCSSDPYTDSPLDAGVGLSVPAATYPISVGAGGAGGSPPSPAPSCGGSGNNSIFSTITSTGGGGGGKNCGAAGLAGGSGGGGGGAGGVAGAGNTPPVTPPQGNSGGTGGPGGGGFYGGGGGGATATGNPGNPSVGGAGATTSINGTPTARAGGGGGAHYPSPTRPTSGAAGGTGGGGAAGSAGPNPFTQAGSGTANTGGGGGAGGFNPSSGHQPGGAGGSGVVIIRYKFQN